MLYTIENEQLKVTGADRGAELMSIVGKKTGTEYLWQGNPEFWGSRASILFPVCGRQTDGKYTWQGRTYEMPIHGFARQSTFTLAAKSDTSLTLELCDNAETRRLYPFAFRFRMTYTLEGGTLENRFEVVNTGDTELPFAIGGHPGFNVPFAEGEAFEDYYLEFGCVKDAKKLVFSPTCYYTDTLVPFPLREGKILDLRHDLFDDDAIFLADMCKKVSLRSAKNDRAVTITYKGMSHVGFWHKPKTAAPYVCIEPWNGVPALDGKVDDFATKLEMTHLAAGEVYTNAFEITVTE